MTIDSVRRPIRVFALLSALALAACAGLAGPAKVADGTLTDPSGRTLYTFDRDAVGAGKSACNGPCARNWPAFVAAPGASSSGDWTVVTRDDGTRQWAFKGRPLYTFAHDANPGDRRGDGFAENQWHVARP